MKINWKSPVIFLSLVMAMGYIVLFTGALRYTVSLISYPALLGNAYIVEPFIKNRHQVKDYNALQETVAHLKKEYEVLQRHCLQLRAKLSYLDGIKEIRKFSKRYAAAGNITKILARNFTSDGQYFLIDAGEHDAISKDMVVLYNDTVVGKVAEVYPRHSKVCLITDTQCKIGAYCAASRTVGIHEGRNENGVTRLNYVDHLAKINEGDVILTSGEGLIFPEGFALGTVSEVSADGLYKSVSVKPFCDFQHIDYCVVMANA